MHVLVFNLLDSWAPPIVSFIFSSAEKNVEILRIPNLLVTEVSIGVIIRNLVEGSSLGCED